MSQNTKTLIVFVGVLITVGFWMPLSNSPRLGATGGTVTETYFGMFRYATMQAVMREPNFSMNWTLHGSRLAVTIVVTLVFWALLIWIVRRKSAGNRPNAE